MELTILMPCLNESETLANCIRKAKDFLLREKIEGEVLISDNGSTDGSQALAIEQGARVVHVKEKGYGAALLAGIDAALGKYIIMGDSDDSYDFSNLQLFVQKLREGNELAMGNRFKGGIKKGAMPFLNRYLGNPVLSFLGRLFFRTPIGDFHCGLRGFNREAIKKIDLKAPGMEFASEMVIKASLKKLKICEVPTILAPDGRSRPPHLRKWRDGWRHLSLLLSFSPRWLFLYPGLLLSALGFVLMCALVVSPIRVGVYIFDTHTLLFSSAFFIVGLQAIFFAVFSKLITSTAVGFPVEKKFDRIIQRFTLEKGIVIGLTLILLGVLGSFISLYSWSEVRFGLLLQPDKVMRIVIPSVAFLIAGAQFIFSSFFMNILALINTSRVNS